MLLPKIFAGGLASFSYYGGELRTYKANINDLNIFYRELKIYAPACEQTTVNRRLCELNDTERALIEIMREEEFALKFRHYMSVEEKKGEDLFNAVSFTLFYVGFPLFPF